MDKLNKQSIVFVLAAFALGIVSALMVQPWFDDNQAESQEIKSIAPPTSVFSEDFFDRFFDDDFFDRSRDPFQEMERMHERMNEQFGELLGTHPLFPDSIFDRSYDTWFSREFGDRSASSIRQEEDERYVYYHLDVGENQVNEATLTVKDNYVEIFARVEQDTENSYLRSSTVSETHQRFPVPYGVDPDSAKVTYGAGNITIRFTKHGR